MKYYIAENGQPAGPFELNELLEHGLTVNSQVWNESMTGWTAAGSVPEVMNLLRASSQPVMGAPVQQPQEPAPDYSAYQPGPQRRADSLSAASAATISTAQLW